MTAATPAGARDSRTGQIAVLWAVSRAATALAVLIPAEASVLADVRTFAHWASQVLMGHLAVGPEYPVAGLVVIALPGTMASHSLVTYLAVFMVLILLVDAGMMATLWRLGGAENRRATLLWLAAVPCLGPLALTRFDLLPATLTVLALLLLSRFPARAGACLGAAVAVKIWPAAVLPAMFVPTAQRRRVAGYFLLPLGAAALLTAWLAGAGRLLSPLLWQRERGLQVESLPALPLMWLHAVSPRRWPLHYAHGAWEVHGPGSAVASATAWTCLAICLLLLGLLWRRAARPAAMSSAALLAATTLFVVVATARNLSPQYLLWLGAVLAAALCLAGAAIGRAAIAWFVLACALTQVVYPLTYVSLLAGRLAPLVALSGRDVALVVVTVLLYRTFSRQVRQDRPVSVAVT